MKPTNEQQQAINHSSGDLLVVASAGSGKTSTMIARVARLLCEGEDVDGFLLVTFTINAASEMKDKLEKLLLQKIASCTDSTLRTHLIKQMDKLPLADISTVDSFCKRLISRYFEYLNLDPHCTIVSETQRAVLQRRIYDRLVEARHSAGNDDFIRMYQTQSNSRKDEKLRETITKQLYSYLTIMPDYKAFVRDTAFSLYNPNLLSSPLALSFLEEHKRVAEALLSVASQYEKELINTKYSSAVEDVLLQLKGFLNCSTLVSAVSFAENVAFKRNPSNTSPYNQPFGEFSGVKEKVKAFFDKLKDQTAQLQLQLDKLCASRTEVEALLSFAVDFIEAYVEVKREKRLMDFIDLERYALKLLSFPQVKEELRAAYKYVFIDEYQDINRLQNAILDALDDNNAFFVGDVKQSIYRFRQTEPQIILDKAALYDMPDSNGSTIAFNVNFRSVRPILDFVNDVFSVVMTKTEGGVDYAASARLTTTNAYKIDNAFPMVRVALVNEPKAEAEAKESCDDSVYSVRDAVKITAKTNYSALAQAQFIYNEIVRMVTCGKLYTVEPQAERPIKYSDIAILFSSRSGNVATILGYLADRGLPVKLEDVKEEAATEEIEIILAFLRMVDNGMQDVPLIKLMLSSFGGFTEEELAEIALANPREKFFHIRAQKYAEGEGALAEKLRGFYAAVSRHRLAATASDVYTLVSRFVTELGLDVRQKINTNTDSFNVLRNFLSSLYAEGFETVSDYLDYYDNFAGKKKFSGDGESSDDCITVSTVHASKGLEYEVVFLIDIDRLHKNTEEPIIKINADYGIALRLRNQGKEESYQNILGTLLDSVAEKEEREVQQRTLYVALTRARKHLYVCGGGYGIFGAEYKLKPRNYYELLNNAFFVNKALKSLLIPITYTPDAQLFPLPPTGKPLSGAAQNAVENYPFEGSTTVRAKLSVTELSSHAPLPHYSTQETDGNEERTEPTRVVDKDYTAVEKGIAMHRAMELVDFELSTAEAVAQQLQELAREGLLTVKQLSLIDAEVVFRCISQPLIKASSAYRTLREQPFFMSIPAREVRKMQHENYADSASDNGATDEGVAVSLNDTNQFKNQPDYANTADGDEVLVQGIMDLLILSPSPVIVDYKCSHRSSTALLATYKQQLQLYKRAVEDALSQNVSACYLLVLNRGELIRVI